MTRTLVVHGHFYQPPRENPWTGSIDREPSAAPFGDWNERIHQECYRANAFARIVDRFGKVERIVNNYALLSFNFGPTLFSWLKRKHPRAYAAIIEADRISAAANDGHGNAIAQGYNHAILPLCNDRDRRTQVRWGKADFRHRFGREPEALWLPETACCEKTLELLIDEGMRYVILSPHQAARVRPLGADDGAWRSVSAETLDTTRPYLWRHSDGDRSIAVFFYDGGVSQAVAFEGALASSHLFVERLARARRGEGDLVTIATDGETYGHHHALGERGLAYALHVLAPERGFRVTNYGAFLDAHPPRHEVRIETGPGGEGTAWSCAHGVGRWYRDCGCATDVPRGWNQKWREPLRRALDLLRDEAASVFEARGAELFTDPWAARDAYVEVLLDRKAALQGYLSRVMRGGADEKRRVTARTLLELQHHAMLMYTSCGWFFGELSRLETVQVMKYAARALDLLADVAPASRHRELRRRFLGTLAEARSNVPEMGNGADVFDRLVEPHRVKPQAIAAHLGFEGLVGDVEPAGDIARYHYGRRDDRKRRAGRISLATGRVSLTSRHTGSYSDWAFAALHLGGVDFIASVRPDPGDDAFARASDALWDRFESASLPALLRMTSEEFGPEEFGLEHVLPRGRQKLFEAVFQRLVDRFASQYSHLYEDNRRTVEMLQHAGFELPAELRAAAELALGRRFEREILAQHRSRDPDAYRKAVAIAEQVAAAGYHIERHRAEHVFGDLLTDAVRAATADPEDGLVDTAVALARLRPKLGLGEIIERAQEAIYAARARLPRTEAWRELAEALGLSASVLAGDHAPASASEAVRATPTGSSRHELPPTDPKEPLKS